jgi:hypothetical protein
VYDTIDQIDWVGMGGGMTGLKTPPLIDRNIKND